MKIVLISPAHPLRGGIATSSERLARELQAMGHQVVIYNFSLQYPSFLFPGKTQYSDEAAPEDLLIKTRLNSVNPLNWVLSARSIALESPDRIVVRFWLPFMAPCLGSILRLIRLFSNKKINITALIDNIIPHEKRFGDKALARFFVAACDDFVVMSRSVEAQLQSFLSADIGTESIKYVPHPIYDVYGGPLDKTIARQELGLPQQAPLVLFFGLIRPYKGLDLLLEALAHTPSVHALIAGECYGDWQPYQKIISAHALESRVHLHTYFIPSEEVSLYFSAADLVVQPYRSATQSGISQIAFHFEKPVLVTAVGGLPEIVRHGISGYVVPPEPLPIAEAIRDFFENQRAETLIAGVQAEKERFSWSTLAKATLGKMELNSKN